MSKQPAAFKLSVPAADIADLRERLGRTRFPDQAPGPAWEYGSNVAWMQKLVEYWRNNFDWRAQEARLNAFPQYKVRLHGFPRSIAFGPGRSGRTRAWCNRCKQGTANGKGGVRFNCGAQARAPRTGTKHPSLAQAANECC